MGGRNARALRPREFSGRSCSRVAHEAADEVDSEVPDRVARRVETLDAAAFPPRAATLGASLYDLAHPQNSPMTRKSNGGSVDRASKPRPSGARGVARNGHAAACRAPRGCANPQRAARLEARTARSNAPGVLLGPWHHARVGHRSGSTGQSAASAIPHHEGEACGTRGVRAPETVPAILPARATAHPTTLRGTPCDTETRRPRRGRRRAHARAANRPRPAPPAPWLRAS